jgi:hypothetical protein
VGQVHKYYDKLGPGISELPGRDTSKLRTKLEIIEYLLRCRQGEAERSASGELTVRGSSTRLATADASP